MSLVNNTKLYEDIEKTVTSAVKLLSEKNLGDPYIKDFSYRFCWSSNALEGNTLSLDETVSLLDYDEVRSGHTFTEYQEAKNLYRAINSILIPFKKQEISEEWIKNANALIMNQTGEYRENRVYVGSLVEVVYYPPQADQVPNLMKEFMANLNFQGETIKEKIEKIAQKHIQFERIHPFQDGNGRAGRMILNQQLINNELLPISINPSGKYRQAFRRFDKNGDISPMAHIIAKSELEAIGRIQLLNERFRVDE